MWDTSCRDWEQRLLAGTSLVPDLPLFKKEAERAVRVFNRLRLPDVIGTPTLAEATGDWFRAIVAALFGSYDAETNRRHIREVFLLVPKKNGKSSNAAGIMVTASIMNRRPNAELLMIAPTKEIADIAFGQAEGMIRLDGELAKLFYPQRHIRSITNRNTGAVIKIKAADTDIVTGGKQTFTLIDETHVFAARSNAAAVFLEVRGALASRPDGFVFQITTQSKSPPAGVFKAELQKARDVRDGRRSAPLLPVLYEMPIESQKAEAWRDPATWGFVNPNLGRSVDRAFLEQEMADSEATGLDQLILFASQHLNVEIGLALGSDAWVGATHWLAAVEPDLTLETLIERSEVAVVGIDGGGLDDLLGLAVLGRERGTRRWLLWTHAWCHRGVLDLRKEIAPRLMDFAADGDLTIVDDGSGDDVAGVVEIIERIEAAGLLPEKHAIGVDPAGIIDIIDGLELAGFDVDPDKGRVAGIRQGALTLNTTAKTSERRLAARDLVHGGQAMMAWVVGNAKVEVKGNAITITKQAAGRAKIDPLMATLNAVALMVRNPEASGPSAYEDEDAFM